MIKATCFTNLDSYDCTIVSEFCALPRIGDKVDVALHGRLVTLKVCSIRHCQVNKDAPFIVVELNK